MDLESKTRPEIPELEAGGKMKSKVYFADEKIKVAFEKLKTSTTEDRKLYEWLSRAIDDLEKDAFSGIQIPKKLIPKAYIAKYEIDNLWKYNLPNAWRLIYSVARDEIVVISIIIEWFDHKSYERRFGYG
jgi:Txe/YoeB family toxin of Txe-Axe toxin-antitoxin module